MRRSIDWMLGGDRNPDAYLMEAYIKGEWSGNTPPMRSLNRARAHLIGQESLTGPGTARIVPLYRGEPLSRAGEGGTDA